jgi:hypothetical protein
MAGNQLPIFSRRGAINGSNMGGGGYMTAQNTTADLTSGTTYLLFTSEATNGSYVQRIRFRPTVGSTTGTVARIWLNNGSTTGTATNNILYDEITLPATTTSATTATVGYELPLGFALPAGWKIYATLGTASANGWAATVIAGDY